MSTYYRFYVGYETKDDIMHLFGPYDKFGNLCPMIERSRSFIGNFTEYFNDISENYMDDEIKEKFKYTGYCDKLCYNIKYARVSDLPDINFVKSGYCSVEEVFENMDNDEKYFNEMYSEVEYSLLLQKALRSNDTEELDRLKGFIFYSYPDYTSDNYISSIINSYITWNGPFSVYSMEDAIKDSGTGEYKNMVIFMETC